MLPEPQGIGRLIQVRPDLRLHVVSSGPHEGLPVVMLHGFPEFWWSWRHQLHFLGHNGLRALALDLRGVNHSDKPARGYDPATAAGDIVGLLDALDYEQAVIIGSDYGGIVAYTMALLHPQRVQRLVISNALHPAVWPSRTQSGRVGIQIFVGLAALGHHLGKPALQSANRIGGIGRAMQIIAHQRRRFPQSARAAFGQAFERSGYTATRYSPETARWLRDHLPEDLNINHPTLVLWPQSDPAAPVWVTRTLGETLPNHQLVIIEGAGHWVQQEQPDAVNAAILAFLSDLL